MNIFYHNKCTQLFGNYYSIICTEINKYIIIIVVFYVEVVIVTKKIEIFRQQKYQLPQKTTTMSDNGISAILVSLWNYF